jgi:T5SS/PEP-CTERM-associated repeat protein
MRPPKSIAILGLILILAQAARTRADITINSSGLAMNAGVVFDLDKNGFISDDEKPTTGDPASFNQTFSPRVGDSAATLTVVSSIVNDGGTLTATGHGDCSARVALTGDPDKDKINGAGGQASFGADITLTKPATFSYSGTASVAPPSPPLSIGGGGDNLVQLAFCCGGGAAVDVQADDASLDPNLDGADVSGELPAGTYHFGALVECQPRRTGGIVGPPEGDGHFSFTLTITEARCTGPTSTWVGPATGGAFDDPLNWNPPVVPTFGSTDDDCDEALFDGGQTVDVDLSAGAAALLAPRAAGSRTAGRLHARRIKDLRLIGEGLVILDGVADDRASLLVDGGGRLHLDSGSLRAQNAQVGGVGSGTVRVETPTSVFTTLRTLTIGGGGLLKIFNNGVGQSAEVRIGDGAGLGSATMDGAGLRWTTGKTSVGFGGRGELLIENGAEVDSTEAVVDAGLPAGPTPSDGASPNLCIGRSGGAGVDVRGHSTASSAWHVDSLSIGGLGCVEVTDEGGIVTGEHAGGDVLVGTTEAGEGLLFVNQAGVLSVGARLVVGESGPGMIVLVEDTFADPRINVAGAMAIGQSLPPAGSGKVIVVGDPLTEGASLTSNTLSVPDGDTARGDLEIRAGARVVTATTAAIGTEGTEGTTGAVKGFGSVRLDGSPGADPSLTRWQVGTSLAIGGAQVGSSTGHLDISDAAVIVGTAAANPVVTINPGGRVTAFGRSNLLLTVGGTIHNDGVVAGPVVLGGSYDPSSHGTLVQAFGAHPIVVPTNVAAATARPGSGLETSTPVGAGTGAAKTPPAPQGPIVIMGDADLGNTTLVLQFLNGFAPQQGDAFPIFEVQGQLTGTFANVEIRGLAPGATFDVLTTPGMATSLTDTVALPVVSIKAPAKLKESAKKGVKVQFKRSGPTTDALTVHYRVGGSAENGIDYVALPGTLEIPVKKKSATVVVQPFVDGIPEPPETIEFEVLPGDDYAPSIPSTATITLFTAEKKIKKK